MRKVCDDMNASKASTKKIKFKNSTIFLCTRIGVRQESQTNNAQIVQTGNALE